MHGMSFSLGSDAGNAEVYTDVLIVGAGPSGLMAANLLSRYNIDFRVIEKKHIRTRAGRADCLQPRTLEILQSMGLNHDLEKVGTKVREYAFWSRGANSSLNRTNSGPDVTNPTAFPWTLAIDKGELETVLESDLHSRGSSVDRSMELLVFKHKHSRQRITSYIKNKDTGAIETWQSLYILGCDGSDSLVRDIADIGIDTYDNLDFWAVADVSGESNLPDIRRRCTIRSKHGNCILTPRQGGNLRIRTFLSASDLNNPHWNMSHVTKETSHFRRNATSMGVASALQARISAALAPYTLQISHVSWISQYAMRKSLAKRFANEGLSVFLLGSAAHTHSPLTKQSMNGGMMDANNLAWKLAGVIKGIANHAILASYESERRALLLKALKFDCKVDHVFSLRNDEAAIYQGFHDFEEASGYTSGCGARYPASLLIKEEKRVFLNKRTDTLTPGKRLLPATLLRHIDGNEVNTLDVMPPRGRFSLLLFIGQLINSAVFAALSNYLTSSDSPLITVMSYFGNNVELVDLFLIHTLEHMKISICDLPQPFPQYPMHIFEDTGAIYHDAVGVPPKLGALCLIRPDGYIGVVSNLDDCPGVNTYLENMRASRKDSLESIINLAHSEPDTNEPNDQDVMENEMRKGSLRGHQKSLSSLY